MTNFRLYKLTGAYINKLEEANEAIEDPEAHERFIQEYDLLERDRRQKIRNCIAYAKNLKKIIKTIKDEVNSLTERLNKIEKVEERFIGYLQRNLLPGEKYDDGIHSISWRSSEHIEIDPNIDLPVQYLREKLSYEPDILG